MTLKFNSCASRHRLAAAVLALMSLASTPVLASPGAHGPNGEHLDGQAAMRTESALPRVEAASETFELVAELRPGQLEIMVDRYESNAPVLGATLEVESGTHKAAAAFRAEQGDYIVTDAALINALAAPGEHGMVFTLGAGKDSDLLDGTLVTVAAGSASKGDHEHDHAPQRTAWVGIGVGIAALGLIGGVAWWRRHRRETGKFHGSL